MTVVSVRGAMGTGKSTLAARWREGITFWMDLELGAKRALSRVKDWEKHTTLWHPYDEQDNEDTLTDILNRMNSMRGEKLVGRVEYWETIIKKYLSKCADKTIDNLIYDTWKEVWSSNTQAFLQRVQEDTVGKIRHNLLQIEYGTPNVRMNSVIFAARKHGKDLLLLSHERPVYVYGLDPEGKQISYPDPSGAVELDGYKNTLDLVDWGFRSTVLRDCPRQGKEIAGVEHKCSGLHFIYTIEKSPVDAGHVGTELIDLTYTKLKSFVEAQGFSMV